jgi:heme/copper-type cytochrome/quinol oxidase subunit 2
MNDRITLRISNLISLVVLATYLFLFTLVISVIGIIFWIIYRYRNNKTS